VQALTPRLRKRVVEARSPPRVTEGRELVKGFVIGHTQRQRLRDHAIYVEGHVIGELMLRSFDLLSLKTHKASANQALSLFATREPTRDDQAIKPQERGAHSKSLATRKPI
jgi:hypothetical protein